MTRLLYILSGGWARGRRTYILSALGVLTSLAYWATGDQSGADALSAIWQALASLSVGTAASKVDRYLKPIAGPLPAEPCEMIPMDNALDAATSILEDIQAWRDDPACDTLPNELRDRLDGFLAVFGPRP